MKAPYKFRRIVTPVAAAAEEIERIFTEAIAVGRIGPEELFDRNFIPVPKGGHWGGFRIGYHSVAQKAEQPAANRRRPLRMTKPASS